MNEFVQHLQNGGRGGQQRLAIDLLLCFEETNQVSAKVCVAPNGKRKRLVEVASARVQVFVPFNLAGVPKADRVQMTVMQPSGARTTYSCSSSPCSVNVDKRQGKHLVQIKYLSASGAVLAQSAPEYEAIVQKP